MLNIKTFTCGLSQKSRGPQVYKVHVEGRWARLF